MAFSQPGMRLAALPHSYPLLTKSLIPYPLNNSLVCRGKGPESPHRISVLSSVLAFAAFIPTATVKTQQTQQIPTWARKGMHSSPASRASFILILLFISIFPTSLREVMWCPLPVIRVTYPHLKTSREPYVKPVTCQQETPERHDV